MMNKVTLYTLGLSLIFVSCSSNAQGKAQNPKNDPPKTPSVEKIFKDLDSNKDGKISKAEAKGPLKNDFAKIDLNKDNFITKTELKKAPKPKGPRPPKKQ